MYKRLHGDSAARRAYDVYHLHWVVPLQRRIASANKLRDLMRCYTKLAADSDVDCWYMERKGIYWEVTVIRATTCNSPGCEPLIPYHPEPGYVLLSAWEYLHSSHVNFKKKAFELALKLVHDFLENIMFEYRETLGCYELDDNLPLKYNFPIKYEEDWASKYGDYSAYALVDKTYDIKLRRIARHPAL